jgi:hypothetical protein
LQEAGDHHLPILPVPREEVVAGLVERRRLAARHRQLPELLKVVLMAE